MDLIIGHLIDNIEGYKVGTLGGPLWIVQLWFYATFN